jgi:hypothetical protein
MPRVGRYSNASLTVDWLPSSLPRGASAEPIALATDDRQATTGLLYQPSTRPKALVALIHPRVDFSRHYLIPGLLRAGLAVWAQRSRAVNNDSAAVHEQLLLDVAAAQRHLVDRGFERIFFLGNSGGASLYCFYLQQAARRPEDRLTDAPSGMKVDLSGEMPMPAGLVLLAPHAGQGALLSHCIDPSLTDESDPTSLDRGLSMFEPANGFRPPPESSAYPARFLERYRAAQLSRVARIDAAMRERLSRSSELRRAAKKGDPKAGLAALAAQYVTVHRTDADPRTTDLSLDPSDRDYGSIFGRRPDITNFGAVGFGRLTTPHAWLSTWSGISSRALLSLTAPDIEIPVLLVRYTADNSVFPEDINRVAADLTTDDLTRATIEADHYGYAPRTEDRVEKGGEVIAEWVLSRS